MSDPFIALLVAGAHRSEGSTGISAAVVDELIERAVLLGGTTETAAQELGVTDERMALALLALAYPFDVIDRAAIATQLQEADLHALRSALPKRLAASSRVAPVALVGRRLTVVTPAPADVMAFSSQVEELGFALSLAIKPVLTTEALWSVVVERVYAKPVPDRLQRVLNPTAVDVEMDFEALELERTDQSGWQTLTAAKPWPEVQAFVPVKLGDESGWTIPAAGQVVLPQSTAADTQIPGPAARISVIADGTLTEGAPASLALKLQQLEDDAQRQHAQRRQKVLWSANDAIAELALCDTKDALLETVLRFAYRRLRTAAVFVQLNERLTCFDILDPLLDGHELRRWSVPVTDDARGDHLLGRAARLQAPVLGPLDADDPLCRLLGRRPRAALAVPVVLGTKTVAVIAGDNDDQRIDPALLGELNRVLPAVQLALTTLIKRRKGGTSLPAPAPTAGETLLPQAASQQPPPSAIAADTLIPQPAPPSTPPPPMPPSPAPAAEPSSPSPSPSPARTPHALPAVTVAPSPGARAKEALLLATAKAWLQVPPDETITGLLRALEAGSDARVGSDGKHPGNEASSAALARLQTLGLQAMPDVARAFPGKVAATVDSAAAVAEALRTSPLFVLLGRLGRDLCAPIIAHAIDDDDRQRRFAGVTAARALGLSCCLPGLGRRLTDAEPRVAVAAIEAVAIMRHEPGTAAVLARMRDLCKRGHDPERRFAIRAVAALADIDAVPNLIDLVGARPRDLADEARAALVEICRQDFGSAERRWRAWFTEHQGEPRRRWLLTALAHKEHGLRAAAAAELAESGVALLGYVPDAPPSDRAEALARVCAALNEPVPVP